MSTQSGSALAVPILLERAEAQLQPTPFYLPKGFDYLLLRLAEGRFTPADFAAFAAENPDLRLEMNKEGEMIVMMPVGPVGSNRNGRLTARLFNWADLDATGIAFDATAGFKLPNGAERSPDASWIRLERWEALTLEEQETFSPICPDFVVELRSRSDRLKTLRAKMEEYLENGAQLGWLLDPLKKKVHVYRPGAPVEILDNPSEVSGEPLLPGFMLKLAGIID
ncbi:MAG: Uma2 family endonuclease [Acidobacteria bacterium]|nr:Uma2 family endonuclease [Acidobacteriota bacterium]MBI3428031.1 Uma2 family endonuclease [Acidobacteriota bacterium]